MLWIAMDKGGIWWAFTGGKPWRSNGLWYPAEGGDCMEITDYESDFIVKWKKSVRRIL